MQNSIHNFYNATITALESDIKKVRKILTYLYLIRLFTFLVFGFFLVFAILDSDKTAAIVLSSVSLILFLIAIKYDLQFGYKKRFLQNKLLVNQSELKFLDHQYSERETGEEYNCLNPHLAADFDIFGQSSLYQYLNRCSTRNGKNRFAENLCNSQLDEKIILEKQNAIKELSEKKEFIQDFQAYGMFISESGNELENLQLWLDEPEEKIKTLQILSVAIPLINIAWITLIILGFFSVNALLFPILLSYFVIGVHEKKIKKAHSRLNKTAKTFEKYTELFELIEKENFESSFISKLKQKLFSDEIVTSRSLKILFKLLHRFDLRSNLIVSFILSTLVIFDIQVYCRLAKWKAKHKSIVASWFESLSETDVLISLSTFALNNSDAVSYPKISEKDFTFNTQEMGHPLLHPKMRINNSISFGGTPSVIIITGANMAGKSTFLRTVSVNLILAMNGAPVCARDFLFTPCDIMSSIKIQDSLSNNESYFYAELVRIKDILEHSNKQKKTLVVLDEILRGTNTKDKQLGSLGLLEKLISQNAVVIVATHDLMIG
ncbi:MAG: hypothetical protein V2A54_10840, partial [Bacteroidota bacterium]